MIHTPLQSKVFLSCINSLINFQLTDCSYKNDVCDSAWSSDKGVTVFFPNIKDVFNEMSTDERMDYFCVRFGEEEYIDHGFTLQQVISLLNSFDRVFDHGVESSETFTMLEFLKNNFASWDAIIYPVISLNIGDYVNIHMGAGGVTQIERKS